MDKYPLPNLVKRWEREELTGEQAIGQILLWLAAVLERVEKLENHQRNAQSQKSG